MDSYNLFSKTMEEVVYGNYFMAGVGISITDPASLVPGSVPAKIGIAYRYMAHPMNHHTAALCVIAGLLAAAPFSPLEWAQLIARREYGL